MPSSIAGASASTFVSSLQVGGVSVRCAKSAKDVLYVSCFKKHVFYVCLMCAKSAKDVFYVCKECKRCVLCVRMCGTHLDRQTNRSTQRYALRPPPTNPCVRTHNAYTHAIAHGHGQRHGLGNADVCVCARARTHTHTLPLSLSHTHARISIRTCATFGKQV